MLISPVELLIITPMGCPIKEYIIGVVPVAVTWKVPPTPLTTVVLFAEVMASASALLTVTVKFKVFPPTVMVRYLIPGVLLLNPEIFAAVTVTGLVI
ncbi:hypothetical protein AGMMS50293_04220 [Spirochaetia bacterium]|nr:hypothetical protein AGMMS50293_04220 [Spirochaetia bacterium]